VFSCALLFAACSRDHEATISISASAVGAEGRILQRQIDRFMQQHPGVHVRIHRTPDDATQRHQLYVQWLNARIGSPDVLQIDVVWTPELAAAGWILPLGDDFIDQRDFVPATIAANRWQGQLYAVPWFVDVGMLYRRVDIARSAPASLSEIITASRDRPPSVTSGFVWQGARYEGLVTVFLEILAAHGGRILDDGGRPQLATPQAIAAAEWMREAIASRVSPRSVLTWHEEETRFAFQNGAAVFMRNWPYALPLLEERKRSAVAGLFAISPMPPADAGGRAAATLGGAQLVVNRWSGQPGLARALISFLTAPEQMLERAQATGQYPPRLSLYGTTPLDRALGGDSSAILQVIAAAVARPSTPVYSELSEALQIELHRTLSGEIPPAEAMRRADAAMTSILARSGLLRTEER
jgi:ABC-type glycerol-3-phosphate transport system substrate-binding protein